MVPYCSCCLCLYFGSSIMLVTYFVNLGSWMTTYLGKSCSFCLPRVPFVNCRQFMYLVISLLVLMAGYGIWLYQFLIIAYLLTLVDILRKLHWFLQLLKVEPGHEKMCLTSYANKAQISLISAFVVCCLDSIISLRFYSRNFKTLASFCGCAGRFVSGLVGNARRHVCHVEA